MTKEERMLAILAKWSNSVEEGEMDTDRLLDILTDGGIIEETTMTEPCGEGCTCAEIDSVFPVTCRVLSARGKELMAQLEAEPT